MPDEQGWVSGAERKSFGPLGRPPDSYTKAPKYLRDRWKKLQTLAKSVIRMTDPDRRRDYARHVARERANLVKLMDEVVASSAHPDAVALFKRSEDD